MIDTDGPHSGPYPIGKNEGPATMAEPISYDDFAKLELRVAKVLEARPHPNADKLLLMQVVLGTSKNRSSREFVSITRPSNWSAS